MTLRCRKKKNFFVYRGLIVVVLTMRRLIFVATLPHSTSMCAWSMCRHTSLQDVIESSPRSFHLEFFHCKPGNSFRQICLPNNQKIFKMLSLISHFSLIKVGLNYFPYHDLCRFVNVKYIYLERNLINHFKYPGDRCLVKTKFINLSENHLRYLNLTEFLFLPNLEDLLLDDNEIQEIYVSVIPFHTMLRKLTAKRNKIHTIDVSIIRILSLSFIDISSNEITKMSNRLKWDWKKEAEGISFQRSQLIKPDNTYTKDIIIMMRSNNFSNPFSSNHLWGLEVGDMLYHPNKGGLTNHNFYSSDGPEQTLYNYKRAFDFINLKAEGSSIACTCRAIDAYRYFKNYLNFELLSRLGLQEINFWLNLPCNGPTNVIGLKLLNLSATQLVCELQRECPRSCVCTEYVHPEYVIKVNCTSARMQTLPDYLPRSPLLSPYDVYLEHNQLTHLHLLPYPQDVRRLWLSHNLFTEWADFSSLLQYNNIQLLDLRNNQMSSIPTTLRLFMMRSPSVKLMLDGNPFQCDCIFLQDLAFQHISFNLHCFDNENVRHRMITYKNISCNSLRQTLRAHNRTKEVFRIRTTTANWNNQWILMVVAIGSGLLITFLATTTAIIIYRYVSQTRAMTLAPHLECPTGNPRAKHSGLCSNGTSERFNPNHCEYDRNTSEFCDVNHEFRASLKCSCHRQLLLCNSLDNITKNSEHEEHVVNDSYAALMQSNQSRMTENK